VQGLPADVPFPRHLGYRLTAASTAWTALYLCSDTLIPLMRGSVKNQPK